MVLPLVVIGALAPLMVSSTAFPNYTFSVDEVVYVSQAEALAQGDLTLPRSGHEPNFVPPLSGRRGDRIVFKYQPAWPAFLALAKRLTGSYRPALALAGAAAVLAMYAFAYELFRRRRLALVAAAAFIGSPFVLVQSGTHLAYLPTVTLLLAGSACVFRGLRTRRGPPFVAAGGILGLAFFHRSFDAVGLAVPGSRPALLARTTDRRVFESRTRRRSGGLFRPAEPVMIELRLERTDRFVIPLDVVAIEDSDQVVATVGLGDHTRSVDLGPMKEGERRTVRFTVVAQADAVGPNEIAWSDDGSGTIRAGVVFGRRATDVYEVYELRWEARRTAGRLEVVAPAVPFHRYRFAGGKTVWTEEDVAPVLRSA